MPKELDIQASMMKTVPNILMVTGELNALSNISWFAFIRTEN